MSLEEMILRGELVREPANREEIRRLLAAVDRRLDDARRVENHPETRMEQAYHAVLGCATLALRLAALRLAGLRPTNILGKHQFVLESLKDTLAVEGRRVDYYQRVSVPEFGDDTSVELPSCRVPEARQPKSMKAQSTCPSMTSKRQSRKRCGSMSASATR